MRRAKCGLALITIGLLLIAVALFIAGYNIYTDQMADRSARQALERLAEIANLPRETVTEVPEYIFDETETVYEPSSSDKIEIPDYILDPNMKMPTGEVDGVEYIGILKLPSLELELPIISEWDYPSLKTAPCRYSGSVYKDDIVICGHDYRAHFGNLKQLSYGDKVLFTDMDGNIFNYTVADIEVLSATAIDEMTSGEWDMTMFTCTVGGQNRLAVRLDRTK